MEAGLHRSELTFPYAALAGWRWPAIDIVGQRPGPRLAVIAGIHVNETSSIEATIRLQRTLDPSTLKGRVSLRIPPETQNGRTIRLAGQGMPRAGGGSGDLFLTVKVVLPTKLSDEDRACIGKLGERQEDPRRHLL